MQFIKFGILPATACGSYYYLSRTKVQAEEEVNPLFDEKLFPEFSLTLDDKPAHIKNKFDFKLKS